MPYKYILNDQGEPVPEEDLKKWASWFEQIVNRRVALTDLPNGWVVSTIFLALDHNIGGRVPILFESMVFDEDGQEQDSARYATRAEAEGGHASLVAQYQRARRSDQGTP